MNEGLNPMALSVDYGAGASEEELRAAKRGVEAGVRRMALVRGMREEQLGSADSWWSMKAQMRGECRAAAARRYKTGVGL